MDTTIPMHSHSNKIAAKEKTRFRKALEARNELRLVIVQEIVPLVTGLASSQFDDFFMRLAIELQHLAQPTTVEGEVQDDAHICGTAYEFIQENLSALHHLAIDKLNTALTQEINNFNIKKINKKVVDQNGPQQDITNQAEPTTNKLNENKLKENKLQERELEERELVQHLSQTLEEISEEPLVTLNILIGQVLNRAPIEVAQNPFRPEVFVDAVSKAWQELSSHPQLHLLALRLMQPNIFLQLTPIYEEINHKLIERGIVADNNLGSLQQLNSQRTKKSLSITDRDPYIIEKLRYVFSGKCHLESMGKESTISSVPSSMNASILNADHSEKSAHSDADLGNQIGNHVDNQIDNQVAHSIASVDESNVESHVESHDESKVQSSDDITEESNAVLLALNPQEKEAIDFQFFETLVEMQKDFSVNFEDANALHSSSSDSALYSTHYPTIFSTLRKTLYQSSAANLSIVEKNKVELLARIFDYIFADQSLRNDIKCLIAPLQFPLLRVALVDEDFFYKEDHPARTLINILAKSGLILDKKDHFNDPLLEMMEDVIERVQTEFDEQIDLFSDVVADLEYFLKDEELKAQDAISEPVQIALNEEKMRIARELAKQDVTIRLETGEVAGFLEKFLQEQWIRILTIAHNVKEEKPHALENALKTMDDLIWSLKPKNSAAERQELISKLPSMLSLLNAWLNAIRWDEPERVLFFSKLAERHALMARAPLELSPRRQLEIAVNIAQRASNRRLDRFVQKKVVQTNDEAIKQVRTLERGVWIDFTKEDTTISRYKLTWLSPKRTSFIFANRQGTETFSITSEDLVNLYGQGYATTVLEDTMMDRALVFSLKNLPL